MKILFDQGTPVPLREHLLSHSIDTAYELGWSQLRNGELLSEAEQHGYEIFITTDRNLKYQQNLSEREIAIVVLLSTSWPRIQLKIETIQAAVNSIAVGDYIEIEI